MAWGFQLGNSRSIPLAVLVLSLYPPDHHWCGYQQSTTSQWSVVYGMAISADQRVKKYYDFVDKIFTAIKHRWPTTLGSSLKDFAQNNAMPLLEKYRDQYCCFNDDIQGTAVVVGSLIAACRAANTHLKDRYLLRCGFSWLWYCGTNYCANDCRWFDRRAST